MGQKNFAVVAPLLQLFEQLVNVSFFDSFTLGHFDVIDPRTIVLARKGETRPELNGDVRVVEFEGSLRVAVAQAIQEMGGWLVQFDPDRDEENGCVTINGESKNVSSLRFFKQLLSRYPHVSYGTHVTSEQGIAYSFGMIERMMAELLKFFSPVYLVAETHYVLWIRQLVVYYLQQLQDHMTTPPYPAEAVTFFEKRYIEFQGWLNIIDLELYLRETHSRSLHRVDGEVQRGFYALRENPKVLREHADSEKMAAALDVLNEARVRKHLNKEFGFKLPTRGVTNLDGVLRAHPVTRILFEERPDEFKYRLREHDAIAFLQACQPFEMPRVRQVQFKTFDEAEDVASDLRHDWKDISYNIMFVTKPLNDSLNARRQLRYAERGDVRLLYLDNPYEFWEACFGLGQAFRRMFPDDIDFFRSELTPLEVFQRLKRT